MSKLAEILESGRAPGVKLGAVDPSDADIAVPRALKQMEQTQSADSIVRGMGWKPTRRNVNAVRTAWGIGLAMLFAVVFSARAQQIKIDTMLAGSGIYTNSLVVRTPGAGNTNAPVKLYAIFGYNSTNTTLYLQVYPVTAVPANAATNFVIGPFPVPATNYYSVDFSTYGVNLDGATVVMSTTPGTNTIATACATIQAVWTVP